MICLLLIMMMILVNGLENAEPKTRHVGSILREEEMDAKTKAWLLMVESGKVDEEELRRITPKSIFIAPLLSGRTEKCKEGYRHDHLGQCVKVIKLDPKVQLELLLKRLNTLYSEKKQEEDKGIGEISSGPLHFSIPISHEDKKEVQINVKNVNSSSQNVSKHVKSFPELVPVPLPVIMVNATHKISQTKEIESSEGGPLNYTESYLSSPFEGSGFASGDGPSEDEVTSSFSLFPEDPDYLDVNETETTTDIPPTTEMTTTSITEAISTEGYQSIKNVLSDNDSVIKFTKENVQSQKNGRTDSKVDKIYFPSEEEIRTYKKTSTKSDNIRFPDDASQAQLRRFQSPQPLPTWSSQYPAIPSSIPHQQFWWLPENWKVDSNQQKSTLVKFWSRLPLIHDVSFGQREPDLNNPLPSVKSKPLYNSQHRSEEFSVNSNYGQLNRRGKPFRSDNFFPNEETIFRQGFRNER